MTRPEAGEPARGRGVELERARVDELRGEGRRRHHLRQRGDVEEVVLGRSGRATRRGRRWDVAVQARVDERARPAGPTAASAGRDAVLPRRLEHLRDGRERHAALPRAVHASKRSRGGPSSPGSGATSVARAPSGTAKFSSSWPAGIPSMAGTPSCARARGPRRRRADLGVSQAGAARRARRDAVERAREPELRQVAVELVRLLVHVLEEQIAP